MFKTSVKSMAVAAFALVAVFSTTANAGSVRPADNPVGDVPGIFYRYFDNTGGGYVTQIFEPSPSVPPTSQGILTAAQIDTPDGAGSLQGFLTPRGATTDNIGFVFTGYLTVPTTGVYTLFTESDDGSKLFIGPALIVNNDNGHAMQEVGGDIALEAGKHPISILWAQGGGGFGLNVRWQGPGIAKALIPGAQFTTIPFTTNHPAQVIPAGAVANAGVVYNWIPVDGLANSQSIPSFEANPTVAIGVLPKFTLVTSPAPFRTDNFSFRFQSSVNIVLAGTYRFFCNSDDGSRIFVDDFLVVENDRYQGTTERSADINLASGRHKITVEFAQGGGGYALTVSYSGPDGSGEITTGALTAYTAAPVVITPNGGTMAAPAQVTMSTTTPGAAIYYTLDGTFPTPDNAAGIYTGPFNISADARVTAIAFARDMLPSLPVTATFKITNAPPNVIMASAFPNNTTVNVTFDRAVDAATAQNAANYVLDNGATVSAAALDGTDPAVVHLTTSALASGTTYTLTVSGITAGGVAMNGPQSWPFQFYATGTIARQQFGGTLQAYVINGGSVANLTGDANFPNNPSVQDQPALFEAPSNIDDNYGTRMRGYFYPPTTAQYTFALATDDGGEFYLSTDESPANKQLQCYINNWTGARRFATVDGSGVAQQQSTTTQTLIAGKRYYVELLQKEGGGLDNAAVAAATAGTPINDGDAPIPGAQLSPYFDVNEPVVITQQPGDRTVLVGSPVTFSVSVTGSANITYQWYFGVNPIGGATGASFTIPSAVLGDAGAYSVVVTNPVGSVTSNSANLTVIQPAIPTVTSLDLVEGPVIGGQTVTITGTNFLTGQTTVTFGGTVATSINVTSNTSITVVTPAHVAGAVDVTVTVFGGFSGTLTNGYTYLNPPTVTAINPSDGPLAGGQTVTITGTNFSVGNTTVTIGGVAATGVVVNSSTSLTAVTGAHAAGLVDVVVTTFTVQTGTLTNGYAYLDIPTVTAINPTQGPLSGGQTVTITGTNFSASFTTVTIGGVAATGVTVSSSTSLTAVTGAHAAGIVDVVVTTFGTQVGTLAASYEYLGLPTITTVDPTVGSTNGGQTVTITGTNFPTDGTLIAVNFGTIPATVLSTTGGTSIVVTTGASPIPQTVNVTVVTFGVQTSNAFSSYQYIPPISFASDPTATPNPAFAGQVTTFAAGTATAGSTFVWDFGDGTTGTGGTVTHTYAVPGNYNATVTASGPSGVISFTIPVFVSMGATSGTGTFPGATGIVIGASGQNAAQGGSGKMLINFIHRNRSYVQGSVGGLILPASVTQASLIGQPGTLILGQGTFKELFFFTLDKRGKGKATSVPKVEFNVAKKSFKFKVNNRAGLTDLAESIGATFIRNTKTGQPVTILLPVTLQIDSSVYIAMTFVLNYHQIGTSGKAELK